MKKYVNIILYSVILLLVGYTIYNIYKVADYRKQLELYDNNLKAVNLENDRLNKDLLAYKFDIEQLEYINDSIIKSLNDTRKQLGIKDAQIKQMQSIKTEVYIKDSVILKDTVFRDNVKLDTVINNDWYNIKISMNAPSSLAIDARYKSDLNVFAYSNKESLGVPKKCFIGRIFQKKYNVIRVEVVDKNPYSIIKESKFVIVE